MIESKEISNPFPGLRPFETDEYRLFFGREGQADALIARLQRSHFLAVVGTSGSGKSSLVRAGLLPALRGGMMAGAGSGWRITIMRPGSDPIGNLALALAQKDVLLEAGGGLPPAEAEAVIEATLRRGALGLADAARQARLNEHEKLLVVVDQFEELFRFRAARPSSSTGDDASAFVKLLLEAAQQSELSIYVVPTMRSDFLGDCAQFQGLPEAINDGQYLIPRMTRDERRFAITGPVGVKRRKITEPLVNRLMNDVGDNPDQLPILQHALMRTWDHWSAHRRNGEPIGLEHYEAIGAMSDALSLHADEAFNELPDERSRLIAERLFKALTERGADNREIRRPTTLNTICEIAGASLPEVADVIEVFRGGGRSFLMPPAGVALRPETVIDISHESLIRNWRRLQVWVNEEAQSARIYRRLAEAAVLHREGKEGLAIDPALQIALDWRETSKPTAAWAEPYHPEFDESIAYLEASRAARDAALAESERRRNEELERERREREQAERYAAGQARAARRLRWLMAGMAVMFLLALVTAGFAVAARRSAELATKGVEIEKERVATLLDETEKRRKDAAQLLAQKEAALKERDEAEVGRQTQLKKARDAEDLAKKEAARANEQKVAADRATLGARKNLTVAESAKGRSDEQNTALASFLRGDYEQAAGDFVSASRYLTVEKKAVEESSSSRSDKDSEQRKLEFRRGLLLSGIGASERRLGMYDRAVASYTSALSLLTKNYSGMTDTGNADPGNRRSWDIFDTKFGLAQAYRDLADESSRKPVDNSSPTLADEKRKKDEENYLKAENNYEESLALYEKLLKQQQRIAQHNNSENVALEGRFALRLAAGLEELARLYRDRKEYDQANQVYGRILKIRESVPDKHAYMVSLTEIGKFYGQQKKYQEAEAFLTKGIDSAEKDIFTKTNVDESFAPSLVEAYTELGNVYGDQEGKESKTIYAFQLARAVQDVLAREKQGEGALEDPNGAAVTLELMADAFAGLGKYDLADELYNTTFEISSGASLMGNTDGLAMVRILHKLAVLNREHLHYQKAEELYKKLLELVKETPKNSPIGLPEALRDLGSLYANELNRPAEAEPLLKRSLELSSNAARGTYPPLQMSKALAELVKLYRRQNRTVELENAQKKRAEVAGNILSARREAGTDSLTALHDYTEGAREYLEANGDLLARYRTQHKEDDALSLYRAMLGDLTKPDSNPASCCVLLKRLADASVVDLYAKTLDEYRQLLLAREMPEEAAKIADYIKEVESQRSIARWYQRYQRL
jgi:hypothetical protein